MNVEINISVHIYKTISYVINHVNRALYMIELETESLIPTHSDSYPN